VNLRPGESGLTREETKMPTEIYIAVLLACLCVMVMAVVMVVAALHIRARLDVMEKNVTQVTSDLSALIQESRGLVKEVQQVTARMAQPMEDLEHMTRTARGWTERAENAVDAVGTVAGPLFVLARNFKMVSGIVSGLMQTLLARKR
jgi:uncharacterized protein YoxC